jgi:hypothetical protein
MIDDLAGDNLYLFSMTLSLCWESDGGECQQHVIFNNALLPKPFCNWNKPYNIPGKLQLAREIPQIPNEIVQNLKTLK